MLLPERLLQEYMELYPNAEARVPGLLAKNGKGLSWPDWCYLPVSASYAIIHEIVGDKLKQLSLDVGNLASLLAWRPTKGIYRFDETLLKSLVKTKFNKEVPTEVFFNLPEWCCYVDLQGVHITSLKEKGFFVSLEYDVKTHEPELRITRVTAKETLFTIPLHLGTNTTIMEMFQATLSFTKERMQQDNAVISALDNLTAHEEDLIEDFSPFLSIIMYLCTADRDITYSTTKIRKPSKNPKKQKRQLPRIHRVGATIGGAMRRAAQPVQNPGSGSPKGPHIRRGHYHTYWVGKGRKTPIIKFLAPIPVNIGQEPATPIVRHVKGAKKC